MSDLIERGITLTGFAIMFNPKHDLDRELKDGRDVIGNWQHTFREIPSTMRLLYEQALQQPKTRISLVDNFTRLGFCGQDHIAHVLDDINKEDRSQIPPVLLSCEVRKQWLRRLVHIVKKFSLRRNVVTFRPTTFIVVGRAKKAILSPTSNDALTLARPTYIKVNKKHMSQRTLEAYKLPWEVDSVSIKSRRQLHNYFELKTSYLIDFLL